MEAGDNRVVEFQAQLGALEERFGLTDAQVGGLHEQPIQDTFAQVYARVLPHLANNQVDPNSSPDEFNDLCAEVNMLWRDFKELFPDPSNVEGVGFKNRLARLSSQLHHLRKTWQCLMNLFRQQRMLPLQHQAVGDYQAVPENESKDEQEYQQFMQGALNSLSQMGYYRYVDQCYKMVLTAEGYVTYAYTEVCTIEQFVYDLVKDREVDYRMWFNGTKGANTIPNTVTYLSKTTSPLFPALKKVRHMYSYRNGMLDIKWKQQGDVWWSVQWTPHGPVHGNVPANTVATRYFDVDFPVGVLDVADWKSIATPAVHKVLDDQHLSHEVMEWFYAMMGRCLYEYHDLDGWDICPFVKGVANSGKSTLLNNVIKQFYDPEDVGVLSSNMEKTFGLHQLADRMLFIGPEMLDLTMDQSEFQSIVSSDAVVCNIKYKAPKVVQKWTVPGFLAGNKPLNFVDNSDQIARRIMFFFFGTRVASPNANLEKELLAEMPMTIVKCAKAYLEKARAFGHRGIWSTDGERVLPEYFDIQRNQVMTNNNPLMHFLYADKLEFSADYYMPYEDFWSAFKMHCTQNSFQLPKRGGFTEDYYSVAFERRGLTVVERTRKTYPRNSRTSKQCKYVLGGDLVQETGGEGGGESMDLGV